MAFKVSGAIEGYLIDDKRSIRGICLNNLVTLQNWLITIIGKQLHLPNCALSVDMLNEI